MGMKELMLEREGGRADKREEGVEEAEGDEMKTGIGNCCIDLRGRERLNERGKEGEVVGCCSNFAGKSHM